MAKVLIISKSDPATTIEKKVREWNISFGAVVKPFEASKYTGRIKAYGDGLAYQRKLRDEWN